MLFLYVHAHHRLKQFTKCAAAGNMLNTHPRTIHLPSLQLKSWCFHMHKWLYQGSTTLHTFSFQEADPSYVRAGAILVILRLWANVKVGALEALSTVGEQPG